MYAKFIHRTLLITMLAVAYPAASFAGFFGVGVTVGFAPPPLPVYVQPPCPATGYIWTPGYWAYSGDDQDYYWVPGTWVVAPTFGWLWTPGYWGLIDAEYVWHEGYWGPHVGFYGGINYGFGYFGSGFVGGYWRDHDFYYNRSVTNVSNVSVTNVYNRTVMNNNSYGSRPSFNGRNGVEARPTHGDLLAAREPHRGLTAPQRSQSLSARTLPSALASVNHGHPQVAATPRPGIFHGQGVVPSRYASGTAAPARPSLTDRSHGLSSNRDTSHYSPAMNARPQASASHEQHAPNTSAPQHVGYAPNRVRASAADSRATAAHWSPPSNAPHYAPHAATAPSAPQRAWTPAAHSPPARQAFAQAPHNAPSVPRNVPSVPHNAPSVQRYAPSAPRSAPSASHINSQPPHTSRQAPTQGQRRG
jgi:hypothetical protein